MRAIELRLAGMSLAWLALICGGSSHSAETEAAVKSSSSAVTVHTIESEYQNGPSEVHVLLPRSFDPQRRYQVLFVLPVYETGTAAQTAIAQAEADDLANRFGLICVTPSFDARPWYADHATDLKQRQESHVVKAVVPFVEKTYPTIADASGRLLVGYSKSGWGAFSLLLRYPELFGKAAAFDAPLMMGRGGRFKVPAQMGPSENFDKYCVVDLVEKRAEMLRGQPARLAIFGQGNFNDDHLKFHALLEEMKIPHVWDNNTVREHTWNSGWLRPAVEAIAGPGADD